MSSSLLTFSEKFAIIVLADFSLIYYRKVIIMENTTQTVPQVAASQRPAQLKPNFGLVKTILLSLITFGIYGMYAFAKAGSTLDFIAGRYDGKKTMSYWLLTFIIGPITFGIGFFVWYHKISARAGRELSRRGIHYSLSAVTFWLWGVLGALIVIGPFVYSYKLFKAMNLLVKDYNVNG